MPISQDIKATLNAAGAAPVYACRAWVNFNATGTVAIRASGNVSSITDNGTGDYTVNFTTAMPDENYSVVGQAYTPGVSNYLLQTPKELAANQTTSSVRASSSVPNTGAYGDPTFAMVQIIR